MDGAVLLDTNVLLWAMAAPDRLSPRARQALKRPVVLSVVNYWEIVIKAQKGLLNVGNPMQWWARAAESVGGTILAVHAAHISALSGLPEIHKDPFDRMLVAQATHEQLTLLTSDAIVQRYPVRTLW